MCEYFNVTKNRRQKKKWLRKPEKNNKNKF